MVAETYNPETLQLRCMEIWGGNGEFWNSISVPGIDATAYCHPFEDDHAGGDILYVSICGAGNIARFVVADVSGHGEQVSAMAASLRKKMRRFIGTADQSRFAVALNHEFKEMAAGGQFATAILGTYYAPTDHLILCNAGHPPPLWYRADRDTWTILEEGRPDVVPIRSGAQAGIADLPLGVIEPTSYRQFAVPLSKGDMVVLYTDSLSEAPRPRGGILESEGLRDVAGSLPGLRPERFTRDFLDAIDRATGGATINDDITLLVLHHNASDPPKLSLNDRVRIFGRMIGLGA